MHAGKTSGTSSRHRRSAKGPGSGSHKESNAGPVKSGSLERTSALEKTSESGLASEKPVDALSTAPDHGNSHKRVILRIINPGRSPARGSTGSSGATTSDGPPAAVADKHDNERKVRPKTNSSSLFNNIIKMKTLKGLWQSDEAKENRIYRGGFLAYFYML